MEDLFDAEKNHIPKIEATSSRRTELLNSPTTWADLLKTATTRPTIELADEVKETEYFFVNRLTGSGREIASITRSGRALLLVSLVYRYHSQIGAEGPPMVEVLKFLLDKPESIRQAAESLERGGGVLVGRSSSGVDESGKREIVVGFNKTTLTPEELREAGDTVNFGKLEEWQEEFKVAKQKLTTHKTAPAPVAKAV